MKSTHQKPREVVKTTSTKFSLSDISKILNSREENQAATVKIPKRIAICFLSKTKKPNS
jgi:hypothetical protein